MVRGPDDAGGPGETLDVTDDGPGPEDAARTGERERLVHAALEQLSPKLAEVIVLRYPQGRSYEEIGEILDLPPGTVKSRLNRAHAAMRTILGEHLDGS